MAKKDKIKSNKTKKPTKTTKIKLNNILYKADEDPENPEDPQNEEETTSNAIIISRNENAKEPLELALNFKIDYTSQYAVANIDPKLNPESFLGLINTEPDPEDHPLNLPYDPSISFNGLKDAAEKHLQFCKWFQLGQGFPYREAYVYDLGDDMFKMTLYDIELNIQDYIPPKAEIFKPTFLEEEIDEGN